MDDDLSSGYRRRLVKSSEVGRAERRGTLRELARAVKRKLCVGVGGRGSAGVECLLGVCLTFDCQEILSSTSSAVTSTCIQASVLSPSHGCGPLALFPDLPSHQGNPSNQPPQSPVDSLKAKYVHAWFLPLPCVPFLSHVFVKTIFVLLQMNEQ